MFCELATVDSRLISTDYTHGPKYKTSIGTVGTPNITEWEVFLPGGLINATSGLLRNDLLQCVYYSYFSSNSKSWSIQ